MEHRRHVSYNVAAQIAGFFWGNALQIGPMNRKRTKYCLLFKRMIKRLEPFFFVLGHFFDNYRRMVLERAMKHCRRGHVFSISTGGGTLWEDQISILEQYHQDTMLNCYHLYGYLLHVIEARLFPSKLNRMGSACKFQRAGPTTTGEVEILLMLGGLDQVRRVLSGTSWRSRRGALDTFIHGLRPIDGSPWIQNWRDLHVESKLICLDRVPNLRLTLPALHLVWVPSVLKLLLKSKSITKVEFTEDFDGVENAEASTARTPVSFLSTLVLPKNNSDDLIVDQRQYGDQDVASSSNDGEGVDEVEVEEEEDLGGEGSAEVPRSISGYLAYRLAELL